MFSEPVQVPFLATPELGVIEGNWLYVENAVRGVTLHDLEVDRRGEDNRAGVEPERTPHMARRLRALVLEHPALTDPGKAVDPEKLEKLRSLGYIE